MRTATYHTILVSGGSFHLPVQASNGGHATFSHLCKLSSGFDGPSVGATVGSSTLGWIIQVGSQNPFFPVPSISPTSIPKPFHPFQLPTARAWLQWLPLFLSFLIICYTLPRQSLLLKLHPFMGILPKPQSLFPLQFNVSFSFPKHPFPLQNPCFSI